jgi:hypothetical protein
MKLAFTYQTSWRLLVGRETNKGTNPEINKGATKKRVAY